MAKTRFTKRKLEVFSIHARTARGPVNYENLFKTFAALKDSQRNIQDEEKLVAVPTVEEQGQYIFLTAYEGKLGQNPIIFDAANAEERIEKLRSGEMVATKTHAVADVARREIIIEYNHAGAKATNLADVIENALRHGSRRDDVWKGLAIEFNPVVDEEFVKAIERFQRIRSASLRVSRPNPGWTDFHNKLNEMAEESDAKDAEATLTANRGKSLARSAGIVKYIKQFASGAHSILKSAKIIGNRKDEVGETTVSLGNHVSHQKARVKMDNDGHVDDADIKEKLKRFSEERRKKRRR